MGKAARPTQASDRAAADGLAPDVSRTAVESQLDRILSGEIFAHSDSLSRFLRFIVVSTLNGEGDQLKEYRIGVEVFGRGNDFDPKEDTIVRVQARNLRTKLSSYYESDGKLDPVIIELPKGGYAPAFRSVEPQDKRVAGPRIAVYLGLGLISVFLAVGKYWIASRPTPPGVQPSLLVWPLADGSPAKDRAYFSGGFSSDLITAFSRTGALRVVRVPTKRPEDAAAALSSGNQFQVQFVLTGSVQPAGGKVRVVTRLLRTADRSQAWQGSFEKPTSEVSSVLEESARAVLRELRIAWPKDRPLVTSRVASLEAYDLYLRALREDASDSASLLEQAIARDPNYAPAYARLALAYAREGTPKAVAKAKTAAARGLQLDDQLSDAHLSLARLLDEHDLDWTAAEREYKRAIDLGHGSADAYYSYGVLLTRMGRFDEALAEIRRGEEFAPLNIGLRGLEGWTLGMQRRYDQAIDLLRRGLESHPTDYQSSLFLGDVYLHKGDFEQALLAFEAIEQQGKQQPLVIGLEGYAHAVLGHRGEARKLLKRLEDLSKGKRMPPTSFAFIYIGLGERDAAFAWLEKALTEDRYMLSGLKVWPVYDSLHNDARYFALLAKLGLN